MKIVFDIGGTNMRVAEALDGSLGKEVRVETPQNFEDGCGVLRKLILQISGEEKIEDVVGCIAGTTTEEGKMIHSPHLLGWEKKDLGGFLRETICSETKIGNDADMAGLGETRYGAGRGNKIIGYLSVGTGLGGCKVVNGKLDESKYGFEPGWMVINVNDLTGLGESVNGAAIKDKYSKYPQELDKVVYDKLVRILAVGVYNAILFWSPEVVILGGSLIEKEMGYHLKDVVKNLKEIDSPFESFPEIKKAELGDNSGLMGAVSLL